jgi:hypothetical protein
VIAPTGRVHAAERQMRGLKCGAEP